MNSIPFSRTCQSVVLALITLFVSACSPKFDWREVRSNGAPFVATFPAKPSAFSRPVNLDGVTVTMSMTAAEVDGVTFAVGTAEMASPDQAQAALTAMKSALVNNIAGTVKTEKASAGAGTGGSTATIEIEAVGARANGQTTRLIARFVAQDKRIYQVVVLGRDQSISRDAVDTFFSGFKLNR